MLFLFSCHNRHAFASVLDLVAFLHRFRMPQDLKNRWRRGLFGTCHDPDATARCVEMESSKLPVSVAFSCCSRPRPRRRQSQSSHVRSQSRLGAPGTLGRRQSAIGIYFTLETGQEHGTGCLGRFFGVALGVEAVGSQAGAKGSLCRGQPPRSCTAIPHCRLRHRRSLSGNRGLPRGRRLGEQGSRTGGHAMSGAGPSHGAMVR